MAQKIWIHCNMKPSGNFIWLRTNRLAYLVMNCGQVSRQTRNALASWIPPHTPCWSDSSCTVSSHGEMCLQWICQEDKQNIPTANVLPKWQVISFSELLFTWLHRTSAWTALGLWKTWLPRKVNSLHKLQVDNSCDLQEKLVIRHIWMFTLKYPAERETER